MDHGVRRLPVDKRRVPSNRRCPQQRNGVDGRTRGAVQPAAYGITSRVLADAARQATSRPEETPRDVPSRREELRFHEIQLFRELCLIVSVYERGMRYQCA